MNFGVLGIFCIFIAYSNANHLNVNLSILIIWIREESSNFSAICSLCWEGFLLILVLGQAAISYFCPPWSVHIIKLLKVQILGTC